MTLGYLKKVLHLVVREVQLSLDIHCCILMMFRLVKWVIQGGCKTPYSKITILARAVSDTCILNENSCLQTEA